MVKYGKNLIRIWVKFGKNLVLGISELKIGLFLTVFLAYFSGIRIKKTDKMSVFFFVWVLKNVFWIIPFIL